MSTDISPTVIVSGWRVVSGCVSEAVYKCVLFVNYGHKKFYMIGPWRTCSDPFPTRQDSVLGSNLKMALGGQCHKTFLFTNGGANK